MKDADLIHLSKVEFSYPGAVAPLLRIEDFRVTAGETVFIYGPSGSGKTTLLEILAGVLAPQQGRVEVLGQDLARMTPPQRDAFRADHVGYIFQSFNLIPYLTVLENITLPFFLSKRRRQRLQGAPATAARALCDSLGLGDLTERTVPALSVGQQQRVAVARALLGAPEVLLADEPTSALDYDHRERFLKLLFDVALRQGVTVLFVSHDLTMRPLFSRAVSLIEMNRNGSGGVS